MLRPDHISIVEANHRLSEFRRDKEHHTLVREATKSQSSQSHNLVYRLIARIRRYQETMTPWRKRCVGLMNSLRNVMRRDNLAQ